MVQEAKREKDRFAPNGFLFLRPPVAFYRIEQITPGDRDLYMVLWSFSFAGQKKITPSVRVLAKHRKESQKTIQRRLARLEKLGLLMRISGRGRKANEYVLTPLAGWLKERGYYKEPWIERNKSEDVVGGI
jgi:hypothetical protein